MINGTLSLSMEQIKITTLQILFKQKKGKMDICGRHGVEKKQKPVKCDCLHKICFMLIEMKIFKNPRIWIA